MDGLSGHFAMIPPLRTLKVVAGLRFSFVITFSIYLLLPYGHTTFAISDGRFCTKHPQLVTRSILWQLNVRLAFIYHFLICEQRRLAR